jgi:hypothetical protein
VCLVQPVKGHHGVRGRMSTLRAIHPGGRNHKTIGFAPYGMYQVPTDMSSQEPYSSKTSKLQRITCQPTFRFSRGLSPSSLSR